MSLITQCSNRRIFCRMELVMDVSINHSLSFNAQAYSAGGSCLYSPDQSGSLDMAQFSGIDDYSKDVVDILRPNWFTVFQGD